MITILIAFALFAISATTAAEPMEPIEVVIRSVFAPYNDPRVPAPDYVNAPPWSAKTHLLINRWQSAPAGKEIDSRVTPLRNADWLCQCQEWDNKLFRVNRFSLSKGKAGRTIADVRYLVTAVDQRRLKFVMIREGGDWKIDDLVFEGKRGTLTAHLQRELTESEQK